MSSLDDAIAIIRGSISIYKGWCRNHSSVNGVYPRCPNDQWTTGFWAGMLWLSYHITGEKCFLDAALDQERSFEYRIGHKISVDHHDMGFLYTPSAVACYVKTGDRKAREAAIKAADQLAARFQVKGGFLQAWGPMDDPSCHRFIIDCLMNLGLLYWASGQTGDESYAKVASIHAQTCLRYSFRPDSSTYHTFYMDPLTGSPVRGETCQGFSADSFWARGQAWAIYGLALCYKRHGDETYLQRFDKALSFYVSRLPEDLIPYWDLIFTSGSEPRDSSSAAIVSCALLEMNRIKPNDSYRQLALRMLESLKASYSVRPGDSSNGLLYHGTYSKKTPFNTCTEEGVDECVSWGDYFYLQALLMEEEPSWVSYW
jgi:unsaturated chondroitin disaccharide hydrolase